MLYLSAKNVKMPTIVGILPFMSRINFMLRWVEHEKNFIASEPGLEIRVCDWTLIFLILNKNICCGYSNESSQWDSSFEHPKHMLKWRDKKYSQLYSFTTIQPCMNGGRCFNLFGTCECGWVKIVRKVIKVCDWKLIFWILSQNICCEYSKEPSQWDGSYEHPKHMLKLRDKKIFSILRSYFFAILTNAFPLRAVSPLRFEVWKNTVSSLCDLGQNFFIS